MVSGGSWGSWGWVSVFFRDLGVFFGRFGETCIGRRKNTWYIQSPPEKAGEPPPPRNFWRILRFPGVNFGCFLNVLGVVLGACLEDLEHCRRWSTSRHFNINTGVREKNQSLRKFDARASFGVRNIAFYVVFRQESEFEVKSGLNCSMFSTFQELKQNQHFENYMS